MAQPPPHPPTTPAPRVSSGTNASAFRTNQVKNLNFTKYALKIKKKGKKIKGKSNWELSDTMAPFAQPCELPGPRRAQGQGALLSPSPQALPGLCIPHH